MNNVKLIKKKKFVVIAFDLNHKMFIIYINALNISFDLGTKNISLKKDLGSISNKK